jgi:hypothetical protein
LRSKQTTRPMMRQSSDNRMSKLNQESQWEREKNLISFIYTWVRKQFHRKYI